MDEALIKIADGLNRGQPPYTGKLVLVFEDEGGDSPSPVIKRLHFSKTGKCLPTRVPINHLSLRATRKSSFEINVAEVKLLLKKAERIIEARKELVEKLKHINHWESLFCGSQEKKIAEDLSSASDLIGIIEARMDGLETREEKKRRERSREWKWRSWTQRGDPCCLPRPRHPREGGKSGQGAFFRGSLHPYQPAGSSEAPAHSGH